jgi:hypothetical protein
MPRQHCWGVGRLWELAASLLGHESGAEERLMLEDVTKQRNESRYWKNKSVYVTAIRKMESRVCQRVQKSE